jgi:hypothetical protein
MNKRDYNVATDSQTSGATVKPFSIVVTEKVRNGISKQVSDVIKAMKNSDKSDVEVYLLDGQLNAYDIQYDMAKTISKAATDQPVQVIFLSCKDPNALMVMDHAPLFKGLDHDGKYPLKIATTASVNLGELTDFEKQYGISLFSMVCTDLGIISRRLLANDRDSVCQDPAQTQQMQEAKARPPRPLHEVFTETEQLQRKATDALNRIEQIRSTEFFQEPSQKKQAPPRMRLKRRKPS